MKAILFTLVGFLPVSISIIMAGILAMKGVGGWGWFVFIALCVIPTNITYKDDKEEEQ